MTSNPAPWATSSAPVAEVGELGDALHGRRRAGDVRLGQPAEPLHRERDGDARVDEHLELADAPHRRVEAHRPDLEHAVGLRREAGGLQVEGDEVARGGHACRQAAGVDAGASRGCTARYSRGSIAETASMIAAATARLSLRAAAPAAGSATGAP